MRTLLLTTCLAAPLLATGAYAQSADSDAPRTPSAAQEESGPNAVAPPPSDGAGAAGGGASAGAVEMKPADAGAAAESPDAAPPREGSAAEMTAERPSPAGAEMSEGERLDNAKSMEWLLGAEVTSSEGEALGEIEDLVLDPDDGKPKTAILSTGGFLGIGETEVAVPWEALRVDEESQTVRASLTKQELENAPEHEGAGENGLRAELAQAGSLEQPPGSSRAPTE